MRLIALGLLALVGCSSSTGTGPEADDGVLLPNGKTFTRQGFLRDAATCLTGHQTSFHVTAQALESAAQQVVAGADPSILRNAWVDAMNNWQHIEAMAFGPLAPKTNPGGEGYRDLVYAWPTLTTCRVDRALLDQSYRDGGVARMPINQRGLGALEYLVFRDSPDNTCPADTAPNSDGAWAALSTTELHDRRAAFALALATDIRIRADELVTFWKASNEGGGDFTKAFVTAGQGSRIYRRTQSAFNAISDALFYVEYGVKDAKIAQPIGLRDCEADTCPELRESPYSNRSLAHLRYNLDGFTDLFEGCSVPPGTRGLGFADFLTALGHGELAAELSTALQRSYTALGQVETVGEGRLDLAISRDIGAVNALYDAIKGITDLLRTQFVSVLDLELPTVVEGDND